MDQTILFALHHFAQMVEVTPVVIFIAVWFVFALFALAILIEFFRHDRQWATLIAAFASAATAAMAASVFAFLLPMSRPFLAFPDHIDALIPVMNPLGSLPSGHTATMVAFGFGLFLAGRKSGLLYIFFGIVIGLSRVAAGVHFPSDVLIGVVFGIVSGVAVHQIFRLMDGEDKIVPSTQELRR